MWLERHIIPASLVSAKHGEEDRFLGERISRLEAFVRSAFSNQRIMTTSVSPHLSSLYSYQFRWISLVVPLDFAGIR
jgi:hypothetical protein